MILELCYPIFSMIRPIQNTTHYLIQKAAENFRKILKENIEIRHLIAHGVPKKYKDIECIIS